MEMLLFVQVNSLNFKRYSLAKVSSFQVKFVSSLNHSFYRFNVNQLQKATATKRSSENVGV